MPTELHRLILCQLHCLLEPLSNLHQRLFSSTISTFILSHCPRPKPDPEKGLPDVDDYTHDFVVTVLFEGFADGGQLSMKPQFIDVDSFLVLELV